MAPNTTTNDMWLARSSTPRRNSTGSSENTSRSLTLQPPANQDSGTCNGRGSDGVNPPDPQQYERYDKIDEHHHPKLGREAASQPRVEDVHLPGLVAIPCRQVLRKRKVEPQ